MIYDEFQIKKKNGKLRKIVAPSITLKTWQRKELDKVITPAFKTLAKKSSVLECFHGFVPRKNAITAAAKHIGFETTIMFDFTDFFDTITENHLERADYNLTPEQKQYCLHKEGYCAQGFPSSPMLANIAVIPFVKEMTAWLSEFTEDNYAFTIYADDIQISFNKTAKEEWTIVRDKLYELAKEHRLIINPSKTRVRFAKYGARRILGVNVTDVGILPSRKTNRKVKAVAHQVSYESGKAQVLGGLRTWQKCSYPKGIAYNL